MSQNLETIKHSSNDKEIVLTQSNSSTSFDCGVELTTRTFIGKQKLKDPTEARKFLSALTKQFTNSCQHDFDCCGQIYTSARAIKLSRNRVKLIIRQYLNV